MGKRCLLENFIYTFSDPDTTTIRFLYCRDYRFFFSMVGYLMIYPMMLVELAGWKKEKSKMDVVRNAMEYYDIIRSIS